MEPSASPADGRSPSRRRLYFSLGTLLFLVLCFAGLFGGYRMGINRGYSAGEAKRAAEEPVTRVYDVEYLVNTGPGGPKDFDPLVEVVTTTIEPNSWDDVGGPGSIKELTPFASSTPQSSSCNERTYTRRSRSYSANSEQYALEGKNFDGSCT